MTEAVSFAMAPERGDFETHLYTVARWEPETVRDILRRIRMIRKEGVDLDTVTVQDAAAYLARGRVRGHTNTVPKYNNRAKALNAYLVWRDRLQTPPLKLLPEGEPEDRALTDGEQRAIYNALPSMEPTRRAACAIALGVGIRPSEVCRIDIPDLDPVENTLWVRKPAKKGKRRRIPIPAWVGRLLIEYVHRERPRPTNPQHAKALLVSAPGHLATRDTSPHRLGRMQPGSLGRIIREEGELVGVTWNWQIARHTVATRLLREGLDIRYVQLYLGHRNIKSTARYAEARFEDLEPRFRDLASSKEALK